MLTADGGETWRDTLLDMEFGLRRTVNAGRSWSSVPLPYYGMTSELQFPDRGTGYALGGYASIFKLSRQFTTTVGISSVRQEAGGHAGALPPVLRRGSYILELSVDRIKSAAMARSL